MPNELQTATVFTAAPNDNREYWESFKKLRDNYETGKYNSKYLIKGGVLKTSSPTGILDHKIDEHVMAKPRLRSSDDKSAKSAKGGHPTKSNLKVGHPAKPESELEFLTLLYKQNSSKAIILIMVLVDLSLHQ